MHRLHSGLTITVPIKEVQSAALRSLLRKINSSITLSKDTDRGFPDNGVNMLDRAPGSEDPVIDAVESSGAPKHVTLATLELSNTRSIAGTTIELLEKVDAPNATVVTMRQTNPAILCDFENAETVLFVSVVILPAQKYENELLPETLVFATTYCGSLSHHLQDLMRTCKTGLCEIFKHCEGFPEHGSIEDRDLIRYIKRNRQPSAFNSRYSCISKTDVQNEKKLRLEIQDFVDTIGLLGSTTNQDALSMRTLIQEHIKRQGSKFKWAETPAKENLTEFLVNKRIFLLPSIIAVTILAISIVINPGSIGWFLSLGLGLAIIIDLVAISYAAITTMMFLISRQQNETAQRPPDDYIRTITATQLRPVINEMTAAAPLKSGYLRKHFYHAGLRIVNFGRSHLMNVPTVSSLRWLSIDKKRRLLFLSNYSNTTDFYVREFLTGNTPRGVNFMFTNGQGFPDAFMLTKGGISNDPEGYMNVIHTHQHVTDLWYAHDYNLTVDQILRNRKLRNGLHKEMNETEAANWLKLI